MATIDLAALDRPRNYWIAALVGANACAIAAAPNLARALAWSAPAAAILLVLWIVKDTHRWLWCFFFAALLLPPLPIALGDSGPHVALIFAALGLVAGALRIREWVLPRGLLPFAMFMFFLVLLCSSALAIFYSGIAIAAGSLVRVLLFGIAVYVFFYAAGAPGGGDSVSGARRLYWFGALSAAFACIDFYYQFPAPAGYGPQFIWLESGVFRRAQGVFYEASTLGNVCAFFLVMIAVVLLRRQRERPLSVAAVALGAPVFFAALILSYSRGSLLNLCAALVALFFLERTRLKIRRILAVAGCCIAAGTLAAFALFPEVARGYILRVVYSDSLFSQPESVLSGRLANWRTVATFLADHPWHAILGIGYKTLPYSTFMGRTVIVDNMYLSLLAETGIIGLAAFCLLNFAILRTAWRAARRADSQRSFYGAWILCFWVGELFQMLSGDLFTYWRVLPLYFWVLAMASPGTDR